MLGARVPRLKLAAILLLALLTAGQLSLHHHNLNNESGSTAIPCAVCAFSADVAALAVPFAITLVLTGWVIGRAEQSGPWTLVLSLGARAPPLS